MMVRLLSLRCAACWALVGSWGLFACSPDADPSPGLSHANEVQPGAEAIPTTSGAVDATNVGAATDREGVATGTPEVADTAMEPRAGDTVMADDAANARPGPELGTSPVATDDGTEDDWVADEVDAGEDPPNVDSAGATDADSPQSSSDESTDDTQALPTPQPTAAGEGMMPSAGCGLAWEADDIELNQRFNSPPRQVAWREMEINSVRREYLVTAPEQYDPEQPHALIFAFHGLGGDRDQLRGYMNLETPAASEAVVIYPSGLETQRGTGWDLDSSSDDLTFVDHLLEKYAAELCIDLSRVFATGHSYGGCMSNTVGCYRGDIFRAVAPVAGCGPFAWNLQCVGKVAAMVVHSPLDAVEDYSSGVNACTRSLLANGCDDPIGCGCYWDESLDHPEDECLQEAYQPYPTSISLEVDERDDQAPVLRQYLNCDHGYPVVQVDYWRREQRQEGAANERWHNPPPWAPALIWEFFSSLPAVE